MLSVELLRVCSPAVLVQPMLGKQKGVPECTRPTVLFDLTCNLGWDRVMHPSHAVKGSQESGLPSHAGFVSRVTRLYLPGLAGAGAVPASEAKMTYGPNLDEAKMNYLGFSSFSVALDPSAVKMPMALCGRRRGVSLLIAAGQGFRADIPDIFGLRG